MPYCSNCGTKLADTAVYCQTCGIKVSSPQPNEAAQPQPQATPVYAPPLTAMGVLKQTAASPLFLTCAITFTAAIVLNILRSVDFIYLIPDLCFALYNLAGELGLYDAADAIARFCDQVLMPFFDSSNVGFLAMGMIITEFIASIPAMLHALGLWLTYAQGKSTRSQAFKTGGLTLIQVLNIISLVYVCIAFGSIAIMLLLGCFMCAAIPGAYIGTVALFTAFIMIVAIGVLAILYYVKLIKTIRAAKNVARTGVPDTYASLYVAVCLFIAAGSVGSSTAALGVVSALAVLCAAAANVCLGIIIITYRNKMQKLAAQPQNYIS